MRIFVYRNSEFSNIEGKTKIINTNSPGVTVFLEKIKIKEHETKILANNLRNNTKLPKVHLTCRRN